MTQSKKKSTAWMPAAPKMADAAAIRALARGDATPEQQTRALTFIVEALCGTYDLSFRPNSERDTCFAEGRRFVGLQVVKLTKINPEVYKEKPE